jgi:hypothetical protein
VSGSLSVSAASATPAASPSSGFSAIGKLSAAQQAELAQLRVVDGHVRSHEQAHLAAAGPYATGGPSYSYATGPDGKLYAVGGDVTLDDSPDPRGPEETIQKEQTIIAAANAPADPSMQDRMVAAQAAQIEATAERQLAAASQRGSAAYNAQSAAQATGQILSLIA